MKKKQKQGSCPAAIVNSLWRRKSQKKLLAIALVPMLFWNISVPTILSLPVKIMISLKTESLAFLLVSFSKVSIVLRSPQLAWWTLFLLEGPDVWRWYLLMWLLSWATIRIGLFTATLSWEEVSREKRWLFLGIFPVTLEFSFRKNWPSILAITRKMLLSIFYPTMKFLMSLSSLHLSHYTKRGRLPRHPFPLLQRKAHSCDIYFL